ncbi:MAG: hypothetical protein ICV60_06270 [Pyrinomonadaceae bacterium]|nr:hypothetical protein [Pyrinomonadaceae bacterium]
MKIFRVVFLLALVSCFLQMNAPGQSDDARAGLALEVTCCRGTAPTFQSVPNVIWYSRFRQLEGWKPAADYLPVQAVNISSMMEGSAVRVIVSVDLGKKFFEKHKDVGSYLLQENERLKIYDMTEYGLEPFEVAAVRVEKKSASVPAVTSHAPSVEVRDVQAIDATFPMFRLTLRNTSAKNISALFMEVIAQGRLRVSIMPHNLDAKPLIAAGESYEYKRQLPNETRQEGAGYAPETTPNQTLFIRTAVFDDGTFEGDAAQAARYKAYALGFRTQLEQLAARYNQALQSTESEPRAVLETLREQVNRLSIEADPLVLARLSGEFPSVIDRTTLREGIEVVMFETKKDALKTIEEFRKKQDSKCDREALRAWLISSRDKYQKSLDYLKKLN